MMQPAVRRSIMGAALVAYLVFAVWAFYFSRDVNMVLYVFIPVSALVWIVMRAVRRRG